MLIASGPLDPIGTLQHAETILRAMDEIRELLNAKATSEIRRLAGLGRHRAT
jgi:hypothetical protein